MRRKAGIAPANDQHRAKVDEIVGAVQDARDQVEQACVGQGYTGDAPRQAAADHVVALEAVKLPGAKPDFVLLPPR